jgi:hypothetical protein
MNEERTGLWLGQTEHIHVIKLEYFIMTKKKVYVVVKKSSYMYINKMNNHLSPPMIKHNKTRLDIWRWQYSYSLFMYVFV